MKSKIVKFLHDFIEMFIALVVSGKLAEVYSFGFWGKVGVMLAIMVVFAVIEAVIHKVRVKKTAEPALELKYASNENNKEKN